jgi:hypothetical protein
MYENKGTANGGEGLEVHRAQFVYETAIIMLLALTSMSRTQLPYPLFADSIFYYTLRGSTLSI